MKENYATLHRTTIMEAEMDMNEEDLIQREDMVVIISLGGYIKRVPTTTYRSQKRGGKGRTVMTEDAVSEVFGANTHTQVLFFTTKGRVFGMKVYKLPLGTPQARGTPIANLLPLEEKETVSTIMPMSEDETRLEKMYILFATSSGHVRRNLLSDFTKIRANGKMAMKFQEGEQLVAACSCDESNDVLLTTRDGFCIRFSVTDVREFVRRTSTGVRGILLEKTDEIVSMSILRQIEFTVEERDSYLKQSKRLRRQGTPLEASLSPERFETMAKAEEFILTVSENGFGKRSSAYEYRCANRGGQGIKTMDVTTKTSHVVDSFPVRDEDDVMLVTNTGRLIRCPVYDIHIASRRTQGVTFFRVAEGEKVVSVVRLKEDGDHPKLGVTCSGLTL